MKVLALVVCLAAAAVAQVLPAGYTAGPVSHYEKVVETSAQPEHLAHYQQPASLLVKSVEQQLPVSGLHQTAYVSGQPAFFKTVEKIENPLVSAYSGGYEQSAYIQKQPALASLSGYKTLVAQPAVTTYTKEVVAAPAVTSYISKPAVATIEKQFVSSTPAPIISTYNQQSAYVAQPAITTYKKEFVAPAVSSYSAFPAASAYKQESFIAAKPAVASYSAFPAASAYKQQSFIAAQPAVSAYGSALQKDSLLYSQSAAKYGGSAMFPSNYQSAEGASSILKLYKDDIGTGIYQYGYATSNGINHDEEGKVLASGSRNAEGSSMVSGSYSYPGPDGVTYTVKYTADEQGFRAYGDHLPKLSQEAQRAIDESAKYAEHKDY